MGLVELLVALLVLLGLAGSLLPFLPGAPLIFAAGLLYAMATDFAVLGPGRLVLLGVLTVLALALDFLAGAFGARKLGASRRAMLGAVAGALVGVFFGPLGLLVGPILGAVAAELSRGARVRESLRSGLGTLVGMILGVLARFGIAVTMASLLAWWIATARVSS